MIHSLNKQWFYADVPNEFVMQECEIIFVTKRRIVFIYRDKKFVLSSD